MQRVRGTTREQWRRAAWPRSGFHVHAGVGVSEDDRPFALRLARYCARNPLALDGPTAGTQTLDRLESLIRVR